jgi:hypothetical protein
MQSGHLTLVNEERNVLWFAAGKKSIRSMRYTALIVEVGAFNNARWHRRNTSNVKTALDSRFSTGA